MSKRSLFHGFEGNHVVISQLHLLGRVSSDFVDFLHLDPWLPLVEPKGLESLQVIRVKRRAAAVRVDFPIGSGLSEPSLGVAVDAEGNLQFSPSGLGWLLINGRLGKGGHGEGFFFQTDGVHNRGLLLMAENFEGWRHLQNLGALLFASCRKKRSSWSGDFPDSHNCGGFLF